ncbi:hypothetical protein Ndes2526B_g03388 [Nannochloris sp. 'desiccata']|nr:hypothetical protein KSW81_002001 [Chlorella desiccata (nom. nud.)]KAG7673192.1 hypothetical protein KSW81_006406 [Chlorella desiccata (nom. nud.)]KAH7622555.1 hypothetical protein NADE_005140 [Chlorella desiccata (nom. nud.)]
MLRAGRGALKAFSRSGALQNGRLFASQPEKVVDTNFGEFLQLTGAPLLVRLHERGWGALAALPASKLAESGYTGKSAPRNIAIVRDAFAAHDESHRTLAEALHPLGPHKVAVSSDITHVHERLVVDHYELNPADDHYHLTNIGTDLLRFLRGHGMHVRQVSDVGAAAAALAAHDTEAAAAAGIPTRQSTNEVLMVAPTAFVFNQEAAQDNSFMNTNTGEALSGGVTHQVLKEFSSLYDVLTEVAGVKVNLFQHSLDHGTPDACFPNNWFSTHPANEAGGGCGASTLVYYPMKCPNRQRERREDIQAVLNKMGYDRIVDMTGEERKNKYFEGTGVLVIDRVGGTAYVALSERAHPDLAAEWVDTLGYKEAVTFASSDSIGSAVYHTNVMMAIGTSVAVACLESIAHDKERKHFVSKLSKTHEIVDISRDQMASLCGNVLELEDGRGLPVMAMSTRAYNAFTEEQKKVLRKHVAALHHANIDTLEHIGGGGVRCTLAEIFR